MGRISYDDITHLAVLSRGLWLGTRRKILLLRRNRFADRARGPEQLADAIHRQIARRPGGLTQLARMAEIDALTRGPTRRWATSLVALLCVVVSLLQVWDPFVQEAGSFVPDLVGGGELWRFVTANFLHGMVLFPTHVALNLAFVLGLAYVVERPLGPIRCAVVMGVSGVGAMVACALAGYTDVVGASGIVFGLLGATLCLELHFSDRLPSSWRLPRGLLIWALLLEGVSGFLVPFIAGAAHLGGFVAGYLSTLLIARAGLVRAPLAPWLRVAFASLVGVLVLSFTAALPLALRNVGAVESYARDLLATTGATTRFNDLAWRIATEFEPDSSLLHAALELAERAVEVSERANPDILDTLAEVHFQLGEHAEAIEVIDEAIAISPFEPYFRVQRERFTGEREPGDRPDPPLLPWLFRHTHEPDNPGIEI